MAARATRARRAAQQRREDAPGPVPQAADERAERLAFETHWVRRYGIDFGDLQRGPFPWPADWFLAEANQEHMARVVAPTLAALYRRHAGEEADCLAMRLAGHDQAFSESHPEPLFQEAIVTDAAGRVTSSAGPSVGVAMVPRAGAALRFREA